MSGSSIMVTRLGQCALCHAHTMTALLTTVK